MGEDYAQKLKNGMQPMHLKNHMCDIVEEP